MKESIIHFLHTDWLSGQTKDMPEFDEVIAAAENDDHEDRENEIINAATNLQRAAWIAGFEYATNFWKDR